MNGDAASATSSIELTEVLGVVRDATAAAPGVHERGIKFDNVWNENRAASGEDIIDDNEEVGAYWSGYSQVSEESDFASTISSEYLRVAPLAVKIKEEKLEPTHG